VAIVPVRSLPLFAFANDGSIAWLRAAGSKVMAVDAKSGEVLREVQLDPAPFGITWSIERVGRFFVVKDDRETAAYDADQGKRLWKRTTTGPTRVAYVGERGERHVTIAPGPAGVEVLETDLETGDFSSKITLDGTMHYIGVHGTLTKEGLLFVATDQREVFAVDTTAKDYRLVGRHPFPGSHALPPVATEAGVHVAVVQRRANGPITNVATFDRANGELLSLHELPGTAHAIAPGKTGVVLDVKRAHSPLAAGAGMLERVVFRPHAPHIRLAIAKSVDLNVASSLGLASPPRLPRPPTVEIVAAPKPKPKPRTPSARPEMLPAAPDGDDERPESAADGFRALLEVMRARSDVLTRLVNALADRPHETLRLHDLGLRFRDPRVRWSAEPGRDPCLIDVAAFATGDTLATYWYPPARSSRVALVRVDATSGEARWLSDDFDDWLAGFLHETGRVAPDRVAIALDVLGFARDFPRASPAVLPPPWFFEAHGTRWTMMDVEEALASGDGIGAERMLVALGRTGYADKVKSQLVEIYETFGWGHHRAIVSETW
jgi:hypothetical protein